MANKQINELTEKSDVLVDDDLLLVYDSEEAGSEKTKKVLVSNHIVPITSNITVYVDPSGDDNTGDGTSGNPWATPNQAFSWLRNKYIHNYSGFVNIQLNDGTYNGLSTIYTNHDQGSRLRIVGNETTPSNVILNFSSGQTGILIQNGIWCQIRGIKLVGNDKSENKSGVYTINRAGAFLYKCIVDDWGYGLNSTYGSYIQGDTCTVNDCANGIYGQHGNMTFNSGNITNNTSFGAYALWAADIVIYNSTLSGNSTNTGTSSNGRITTV